MSAHLLTYSYWCNAQIARDPDRAMNAQAMLWGLATSPNASERIRKAAYRHLEVIGVAPANPYGEMYEND